MSWHRYFCSLCGAMTTRPPEPGEYARCAAHADLPNERDLIPPDPRETIPTMAAELIPTRLIEMWGADGDEPLHRIFPPPGEDEQATRERGD